MIEPFRHNSWATIRLLEFCRDLDPALLDTSATGTFGPIKETLAHLVGWEEVLAAAAEGSGPQDAPARFASVDDLLERARWLSDRWERVLGSEPHPERLVEFGVTGSRRLVRAGTVLAQVVHHGNHHRSQVCTALSTVDIEPPVLDAWAYAAWATESAERRRLRDGGL
jgi:uncharacterized damage-inducible protein DinB